MNFRLLFITIIALLCMMVTACDREAVAPDVDSNNQFIPGANISIPYDSDFFLNEVHFELAENRLHVTEIPINSDFVLKDTGFNERQFNSVYEFADSIMKLLYFNDKYLYVLSWGQPGVSFFVSRINYIDKYIEAGLYYVAGNIGFSFRIYNNYFFYELIEVEGGRRTSNIIRANLHPGIGFFERMINLDLPQSEVVFTKVSSNYTPCRSASSYILKAPHFRFTDMGILLSYRDFENERTFLGYIDYHNFELVEVFSSNFMIGANYISPQQVSIHPDGILFQVAPPPKRAETYCNNISFRLASIFIPVEGPSILYNFCFEEQTFAPVFHLQYPVRYVGGSKDILVLDYFIQHPPEMEIRNENTSRILFMNTGISTIIPTMFPGRNSIIETAYHDGLLLINSFNYYHVFNLKEKTYSQLPIGVARVGQRILNELIINDTFGFLSVSGPQAGLLQFSFNMVHYR